MILQKQAYYDIPLLTKYLKNTKKNTKTGKSDKNIKTALSGRPVWGHEDYQRGTKTRSD